MLSVYFSGDILRCIDIYNDICKDEFCKYTLPGQMFAHKTLGGEKKTLNLKKSVYKTFLVLRWMWWPGTNFNNTKKKDTVNV